MFESPFGNFDVMSWMTNALRPTQPMADKADMGSQMLAAIFGPLGSHGPGNAEAGALTGASLPDSSLDAGLSLDSSHEPLSILRLLLSFVSPYLQTSSSSTGS